MDELQQSTRRAVIALTYAMQVVAVLMAAAMLYLMVLSVSSHSQYLIVLLPFQLVIIVLIAMIFVGQINLRRRL